MTTMTVRPIRDDLSFGARVGGVTYDDLARRRPCARRSTRLFEEYGLLIFEDVEPTPKMQVALSTVFGPLKDHPSQAVPRAGGDDMLGVIEMRHEPERAGRGPGRRSRCCRSGCRGTSTTATTTSSTGPACSAPIEVPPEGGLTGFVDGIALYDAISPEVRDQIEGETVIYAMDVIMENLRFGRPDGFVDVEPAASAVDVMTEYEGRPRALHPAVWTRSSGEKVLHVSPLDGEGHRGSRGSRRRRAARRGVRRDRRGGEGPQLLPPVAADRHGHLGQLALLHSVSGMSPEHTRCMHRTTIAGDYGLGRFEAALPA